MSAVMEKPEVVKVKGHKVRIPDGWQIIEEGKILAGDKYLNMRLIENGKVQFEDVLDEDLAIPAENIELLIRKS